jgi:hypothetical protein
MSNNWQPPETAPKDGTLFIGVLDGDEINQIPIPMVFCNGSGDYVLAEAISDVEHHGDDIREVRYFINQQLALPLKAWQPMPEYNEE